MRTPNIILKQTFQKFLLHPRGLFLVDAVGALLSAFLLGAVLVKFESIFGIPPSALYLLALFPCVFFLYDLFCYYRVQGPRLRTALKAIAIMNVLYCALSIGLVIYHRQEITTYGASYIVVEISIVNVLALLELTAAQGKPISR